jgi:integrase
MPVKKLPVKVPEPPIDAKGAPRCHTSPRLARSGLAKVPCPPPTYARPTASGSASLPRRRHARQTQALRHQLPVRELFLSAIQLALSLLRVLRCGAVEATGDPFEPYRVVDVDGVVAAPVAAYLRDLQACGRPAATQRSYAMDLLRWFRFLRAVGVGWDQATRVEARDFCCWIQLAGKPGGPAPGARYAAATVAHCETVLRCFYDFHLEAGTGPMVNPFPLARGRRGRPNAHHNPMEPFRGERAGRYRPKTPRRIPRQIPDEKFDELFAGLGSHRDRALVAFWVSTGARAAELLGARRGDADPGQQLITVIRKGTRVLQPLPTSPDAFVWLRLYQQQLHGLVPAGPDDPLWWTLRRPFRPLTYHAARAMFTRAGAAAILAAKGGPVADITIGDFACEGVR